MKRRNFLKNHHKKSYRKADRFKNPYFTNKKKYKIKKLIPILVVLFIIIGIPYLIFTLNIFHIKEINITGVITIQSNDIENEIKTLLLKKNFNIIPQDNILFINTNKLSEQLLSDFDLTEVNIIVSGRKMTINVAERITPAIWVTSNQLYFIDVNGIIIRELTLNEILDIQERVYADKKNTQYIKSNVFLIFDESQTPASTGMQVLNQNIIANLGIIYQNITDLAIEPADFIISKPMTNWLTLKIKHGFNIYLNGVGDPEKQLENLSIILDQYTNKIPDIEYIDLRFDNRIYIK